MVFPRKGAGCLAFRVWGVGFGFGVWGLGFGGEVLVGSLVIVVVCSSAFMAIRISTTQIVETFPNLATSKVHDGRACIEAPMYTFQLVFVLSCGLKR